MNQNNSSEDKQIHLFEEPFSALLMHKKWPSIFSNQTHTSSYNCGKELVTFIETPSNLPHHLINLIIEYLISNINIIFPWATESSIRAKQVAWSLINRHYDLLEQETKACDQSNAAIEDNLFEAIDLSVENCLKEMKSPNTQELTIPIKDLRTSMLQIRQRNGYHIIRRKSFIENFCTEDKNYFKHLLTVLLNQNSSLLLIIPTLFRQIQDYLDGYNIAHTITYIHYTFLIPKNIIPILTRSFTRDTNKKIELNNLNQETQLVSFRKLLKNLKISVYQVAFSTSNDYLTKMNGFNYIRLYNYCLYENILNLLQNYINSVSFLALFNWWKEVANLKKKFLLIPTGSKADVRLSTYLSNLYHSPKVQEDKLFKTTVNQIMSVHKTIQKKSQDYYQTKGLQLI